jgi:hypothetical protein
MHASERLGRAGDAAAVVMIDLDGFKSLNDTLGHAAGDAVLVETADRLAALVRSGDTVARLGATSSRSCSRTPPSARPRRSRDGWSTTSPCRSS